MLAAEPCIYRRADRTLCTRRCHGDRSFRSSARVCSHTARCEDDGFPSGRRSESPFADNSFDVAVMALVIAFLPDPGRAVVEMARVVRPGGAVIAYMWAPGGGVPVHPIHLALESLGLTSGGVPNPAASERDAMQRFWEDAGLESIETQVIRIPTVYSNFDDFWGLKRCPYRAAGQNNRKHVCERKRGVALAAAQLPACLVGPPYCLPIVRK
jgi:SAM-dependent methyltransferase